MVGPPSDESHQKGGFFYSFRMKKDIFLTFDYERDLWRATQVQQVCSQHNSITKGIWETAIWTEAKTEGPEAVQRLIDAEIKNTSVTIVLIGRHTSGLDYVQHAIRQSRNAGHSVIGIHVHKIPDKAGNIDPIGTARFGEIGKDDKGESLFFWQLYPIYRWAIDEGAEHLHEWVREAAKKTGL